MGITGAVAMNEPPYYGVIAYSSLRRGLRTCSQDLKASLLLTLLLAAGYLRGLLLLSDLPLGCGFRQLISAEMSEGSIHRRAM